MPDGTRVQYALFPEIVHALQGNDVITIDYHDGVMTSRAAAPILSYNSLTGCAYILEYDPDQGQLIRSLQYNTLTITVALILVVAVFTVFCARAFSSRLRRIMESMRVIREGNYSHKVDMGGHDELTVLGREINDLTEKLSQSESLQRQFISDASHELKTPLASIKLLSDSILQNDMDLETVREFVSDIGGEADRLTRMSGKLLSLTKFHPETGSDCEITYFRPTIERVRRMLSTIADMACVELRTEIVRDSSILIMEDDLYQIIFNLVENGIKYNLPGGTLTIRLTRMADKAVLTIRDTGMGIPADSLDKIFDRFYRVDKARSRQSGGSGLGLAIVKEMVERNHGTIAVYSSDAPPTGTVFTLVFPAFDVEVTE
jgi:signal transduction histidine kinase